MKYSDKLFRSYINDNKNVSIYAKSYNIIKNPIDNICHLFSKYLPKSKRNDDLFLLEMNSKEYKTQLEKIVNEAREYANKW
tara:strand:+ start:71 stop:313 length:243 start_codon:yes stop_codon:yes gene_type:complete